MQRHVNKVGLSEDEVHQKWQAMSPLIDRMMERVGTKGEFPVAKGSSLAGDDRASNPYQISHALRMCLTAGVDHLHAVKVLVLDHGVIHVAAPSSLVRGALENFGAAYWMLGATSRNDRVLRTLQWYAKNFREGDKATAPLNLVGHVPLENKMQKLYAVAAKRGIAEKSVRAGYRSTDVVTFSQANAPDLPLGVVLPWQLCSGFAHGRPWAYLGILNREEQVSETDPNLVNVRLSSDLTRVLHPALSAFQLLERFLRLYEVRAGNHLL